MNSSSGFLKLLKSDAHALEICSYSSYLKNLILNSGFAAVFLYRLQALFTDLKLVPLAKLISRINMMSNGFDAAIGSRIGPYFVVPHPHGIVLGNKLTAGERLTLMPHVVLGQKGFLSTIENSENPSLGNNVKIGAGAIVLGAISIGSNSIVAAGTVVRSNVSSNSLIFGNPNKITPL